jgi:hypothetical protein
MKCIKADTKGHLSYPLIVLNFPLLNYVFYQSFPKL